MTWTRPVPLIGDPTSARDRAEDPRAWALPEDVREAVHRVIGARRDIRRFRPDPVPEDVLGRVLQAAHLAPSVGHSQPWRFIVVTDPGTRERAALAADRERLAQAEQLDPQAARRLLDLQLEGLREAPIGIVVCCDRRAAAAGVLGRATFPDADLWSCACAIENLWLAARADGLGLGWVTLFRPEELADMLGLPDGVVTLGWLCVGWPDERPPAPGLERAGWSRRAPLSDVVLRERWPELGREPVPPPSHLRAPDQVAVVGVRDHADQMLTPPGALGVLDRAVDRMLALRHPARQDPVRKQPALPQLGARTTKTPRNGVLVLVGADHPITRHGISAYHSSVTTQVMRAAVAGEAAGVVAAEGAGLDWLVVDAGVGASPIAGAVHVRPAHPRGDLVEADALHPVDVETLVGRGRELGRDAAKHGVVALGEVGVGNTTVAAALAAALLGLRPADAVGLGSGADTKMLARKIEVVEAALYRTRAECASADHDSVLILRALGGPEIAVLTGVVLGAAEGGSAVVLDGLATSLAALLAAGLEPAVAAHLIAGQRSREQAHAAVLAYLGLEPILDLRIRAGEGVAACLATRLLYDALRIRRLTARTSR